MATNLEELLERLDHYLLSQGLKQTNQRKIIAEAMLAASGKHFDAESLHSALKDAGHDIGLATVYRTLNLFKDAGLINHRVFADSSGFFEIDQPESHHDHLFCKDCGRVIEFENSEIEALQKAIAQQYGFELLDHRLDLWGKCLKPKCEWRKKA